MATELKTSHFADWPNSATTAPAADDLDAVQRRAELAALEADVSAIVDHPGAALRAHGRILARLTSGTAAENAEALDEYTAAVQRCLVRRGG